MRGSWPFHLIADVQAKGKSRKAFCIWGLRTIMGLWGRRQHQRLKGCQVEATVCWRLPPVWLRDYFPIVLELDRSE
jgi:hypothetical protein